MKTIPGFAAEASLYTAREHYYAAQGRPAGGRVLPAQFDVPPIGINCDARHRSCEWGCSLFYGMCVRSGVPERTCAQRYFVCSDACDVAWEECRGLYRDPNYDPFADRFVGVG
jgi:hypothetical protein